MAFALAPEASIAGYRLAAHETIGSTSTEAMERSRDGERGPLWVVSGYQSAGRGRRGNAWATPVGNLAASLLMTSEAPPATIANLGFVGGVAVVRALESLAKPAGAAPRFTLKWPNDVLADGAKLVGIALETEETPRGRAVVIGIGVNVAHAPDGLAYPVASLARLGYAVTAEEVFTTLSATWLDAFALWDGGRGFAGIRQAWLGHAAGLARPIAVRQGERVREGTFETIDTDGQLVLRDEHGTAHLVSAGDVHFHGAGTLRPGAAA